MEHRIDRGGVNVFSLSPVLYDNGGEPEFDVFIKCRLDVKYLFKTFMDRELTIAFQQGIVRSVDLPGSLATQLDFLVDMSALAFRDDFRLTGGVLDQNEMPDEARKIRPHYAEELFMTWRDARLSAMRDVMLVFIGALLGLAAACGLEWIRPLINEPDNPATSPAFGRRSPSRKPYRPHF